MRIKNKDIAEKLGVSTTTVSLAINNKPGVSDETRRKIMQLLSEYADESAKSIAGDSVRKRTLLLSIHKKTGIIINDKPFFSQLIETIQQEAMHKNYVLNVAHFIPGQDEEDYYNYLSSFHAEGIILLGTEIGKDDYLKYLALGIPVVIMDATLPGMNVTSVSIDNRDSILKEMNYAVHMGHRDIGYLRSEYSITNFESRYEGFIDAIHRHHLEGANHPVIYLPCTIEGARAGMKDYLARLPKGFRMPTIFLSDLDYIAVGAMQALKEAGYRIPEDISIIGYDDLGICTVCDPPLTSTRVNQLDIGILSTDILFRIIEEKRHINVRIYVASEFVERESTQRLF